MFPPGCSRQCHNCELAEQCEIPFQQMFVNTQECIGLISDNKFVLVNEAALNIMGLDDMDQLLGSEPSDFAPKYQSCNTLSKLKSENMMILASKIGKAHFDWLAKKKDGTILRMNVMLKSVIIAKQQAILVLAQVKHSEKEAENELRFLLELTEDLFSLVSQLIQNKSSQPLYSWPKLISPILINVIRQGNSQGIMDVPKPRQTVNLLLQLGINMYDILKNSSSNKQEAELNKSLTITSYLECVERTLNMEVGSITLSARLYQLVRDAFSVELRENKLK